MSDSAWPTGRKRVTVASAADMARWGSSSLIPPLE
jgi:hypothetical protein